MNFLHELTQRMSRPKGILLMGIVATSACGGPRTTDPTATQLQISPKALTLEAGSTNQFVAVSTPAGNGRPITWTSSNPAVATVSENGMVTGVAAGTATIMAASDGANAGSAVTITAPARQLQLSPQAVTIPPAEKAQIFVASTPADNDNMPVTWVTSNDAVATVTDMGVVTGVAAGRATITAASDGATAASTVTVTDPPGGQVRISPEAVTVGPGEKAQLVVASTPARNDMPVTWTTSNDAVATVSDMGVVTGVAAGRATIVATSDGATATSAVTVTDPPVRRVRISPDAVTVAPGEKAQLVVASTPARNDMPVTWTTSNDAVAVVSDMGVVTGVAAGRATIMATSDGATATSTVTVTDPPVRQVRISPDAVTVEPGEKAQLVVASTPARNDMPVTWATSNDAVATVSDMGVVTGVAAGRATIMATSDGATATSTVTVTDPPPPPQPPQPPQPPGNQLLWVSPQAVTIEPWMTTRLVAGSAVWSEPFPKTWTSSDPAVATVNAYGAVTGVATGRATITVTNEGASAQSEVTVAEGPSGGPAWPNEPPGLMLISDYSFNDPLPIGPDVPVGSRGWGIDNQSGNATQVSDPTVPEGSTNVMQYRYPKGMRDGIGPATTYRQMGGHELYVGFWWKASKPFHPHSSGVNKIAFTFSKSNLLSYINMQGTSEPYSITIHDAPLGNAQTLVPNRTTTPVMLGVWHRIELYEKYSTTASSNDGIVRWWVDGVLNGDYTNLNYAQDAGWGEFQFAATFGGNTGETKAEDDYYWYGRVRLSGPLRR